MRDTSVTASGYNDTGFNTFFRHGPYPNWYGDVLASAAAPCRWTPTLLA
jgi:hypothetical protein